MHLRSICTRICVERFPGAHDKRGVQIMKQLKTRWADHVDVNNVLGEYPRPLKLCEFEWNMEICNPGYERVPEEDGWKDPGSVFTGGGVIWCEQAVTTAGISLV